jgi:hypothetical protein
MDDSTLANAQSLLAVLDLVKIIAIALLAIAGVLEFGGEWIARPYRKIVEQAHELEIAQLRDRAATAESNLERLRAEAATADANLLREQRLTANERWRLERLERINLPRSLSPQTASALTTELKAAHFQPVNVAVVDGQESLPYGIEFQQALASAGLLATFTILPRDSKVPSLIVVAVDPEGERLADLLFQKFGIGEGWRAKVERNADPAKQDASLSGVPTDRNCLVIGSNADAAFNGPRGQPGEGLDEHGRPVPAP